MAQPSLDPPGPPPAGDEQQRLAEAIDAALAARQRQAPLPEPAFRRQLGDRLRAKAAAAPGADRAKKLLALGGIAALSIGLALFGGAPTPPPEQPPTPTPTLAPTPTPRPPVPQALPSAPIGPPAASLAPIGEDRR